MVFNGPLSPSSTDSDTESVAKVEKRGWKLGKSSDQLRRKAMRGLSASRGLAKSPKVSSKVKQDASMGSKNGKLPAASSSGADKALAAAKVIMPNLKMYTLAELKSTTRSFSTDTILGEGKFGRVFKGWVDENTLVPSHVGNGIPVAIKKYNPDSHQGLCKWQSEVKFLGKFSHPNLVRLLGYCWEDNHYLLVYEYIQRESLENHLFRKGAEPLPWDVRLKIAIGAARGLHFLHTSENNAIYGLFKSSNILLDADYNAKLSDFGLAKLGPAREDSRVTKLEEEEVIERYVYERYVYAAPEYIATGHLYVKSDVYGFGVILLEMLTGLQALHLTCSSSQQNPVEWARPWLHDKRKLRTIMDPRLEARYPMKAATQTAELTLKCLEGYPEARPSMDEVLATLEHIDTIREKKKEAKASTSSGPPFH
ncbi:probable serine/threonine-protein kinase PIX13 [Eucalyptus grandis]|uniref:probable serine/threonine-protein kinase PIX13 n=1 Tax=Eucalyptus grandis TaxID=71139 RepID=UPI00192EAAD9|nr:probable serine/threonine-protein kinase PIX13 [Eucalyptus grandis]